MNPMLNQLFGNNFFSLFQQIKSAQNPNAMFQMLMQQNPKIQEVMSFINKNGGDAKQLFYNLAQQKQVDPNTIINQLKNM